MVGITPGAELVGATELVGAAELDDGAEVVGATELVVGAAEVLVAQNGRVTHENGTETVPLI